MVFFNVILVLQCDGHRSSFVSQLLLQNTFENNIAIVKLQSHYTLIFECVVSDIFYFKSSI